MIENWNDYKDKKYYNHLCACDCGGRIEVKSQHKYNGIPKYIYAHNSKCRSEESNKRIGEAHRGFKIPREVRFCACDCGETFECKINSKRKYINGHNRRGKGKNLGCGRKKIPREIRVCTCGECGKTFECKISSEQKYIHGHNNRGKKHSPRTEEFKRNQRELGIQLWEDPEYVKKVIGKFSRGPDNYTDIEKLIADELRKRGIFYVHNFQIGRYAVDFLILNNVIIECDGEYWHQNEDEVKAKNRERFLHNRGFFTFHLNGRTIHGSPENCVDKVLNVMEFLRYQYEEEILSFCKEMKR